MLSQRQAVAQIAQAIADAAGTFPIAISTAQLEALTGAGAGAKTLADVVTALADPATAAEICGAGGAAKTLADVVTALGDPATNAEIVAALEAVLKSGTDTAIAQLKGIAGEYLPTKGVDAAGADVYATIVTVPAGKVYRNLMVTVETKAVTVSLDGGTTDHFTFPVGTTIVGGLKIPAEALIQAKNAGAGDNYANLVISAW